MCNIYYNHIYFAIFLDFNVYFLKKSKQSKKQQSIQEMCKINKWINKGMENKT